MDAELIVISTHVVRQSARLEVLLGEALGSRAESECSQPDPEGTPTTLGGSDELVRASGHGWL